MKTSRRRLDVDVEELDRVIDAAENGPLSKADRQKLKTTLHALVERLAQKRNTEKTNSVLEQKDSSSAATEPPEPAAPAGHGRNAASAFTGAEKISVQHAQLKPGDPCPECREGKVYRQKEPKTLIRIVGQAPLKATVFEMERLRCNACCQVFTAAEPAGVGAGKYDLTAVAMIALLKYGTGMPFNRMERLETQLGIPLPAATQWELVEPAAGSLEPILDALIRQAAQGSVVHNDDTGMRILKLVRNSDDGRTGTFTSGIVSIWREWRIALYFTGWKHAGENLADVLRQRAAELYAPIQMCDALSRNTPKLSGVEVLLANCLAHGRRQVVDVKVRAPDDAARPHRDAVGLCCRCNRNPGSSDECAWHAVADAFRPGSAGAGRWRGGAARAGLGSDRPRCSNVGPGRSAGRSRKLRGIQSQTVDEGPPRHADPCALPDRAGQRRRIIAGQTREEVTVMTAEPSTRGPHGAVLCGECAKHPAISMEDAEKELMRLMQEMNEGTLTSQSRSRNDGRRRGVCADLIAAQISTSSSATPAATLSDRVPYQRWRGGSQKRPG